MDVFGDAQRYIGRLRSINQVRRQSKLIEPTELRLAALSCLACDKLPTQKHCRRMSAGGSLLCPLVKKEQDMNHTPVKETPVAAKSRGWIARAWRFVDGQAENHAWLAFAVMSTHQQTTTRTMTRCSPKSSPVTSLGLHGCPMKTERSSRATVLSISASSTRRGCWTSIHYDNFVTCAHNLCS